MSFTLLIPTQRGDGGKRRPKRQGEERVTLWISLLMHHPFSFFPCFAAASSSSACWWWYYYYYFIIIIWSSVIPFQVWQKNN
jgi:hypothetical protein